MDLRGIRDELVALGYSLATDTESEVVAVRNVWLWDVLGTNMTYVVFARPVGALSAALIASETDALAARARELDPSRLPVGFQHARAIVPVYLAQSVEADAAALLESNSPMRLGESFFPLGFDLSVGRAHFVRGGRVWGSGFVGKLRYLAQRLLEPSQAPAKEPVSAIGITLTVITVVTLLFSCVLIAAVFLLLPLS